MKIRSKKGQSIVELALIMPLFLMFFLGIVEFGFYFWCKITLQNAVREGARAAVVYTDWATNTSARTTDVQNIVLDRAQNLPRNIYNSLNGNIVVTLNPNAGSLSSVHVAALNVPYTSISGFTDIVMPNKINAEAEFRYER